MKMSAVSHTHVCDDHDDDEGDDDNNVEGLIDGCGRGFLVISRPCRCARFAVYVSYKSSLKNDFLATGYENTVSTVSKTTGREVPCALLMNTRRLYR